MNGGSFGGEGFDPVVIAGVKEYQRRGRFLELRLTDGRFVAFDPLEVCGASTRGGEGLRLLLRGGGPGIDLVGVDPWGVWDLVVAGCCR